MAMNSVRGVTAADLVALLSEQSGDTLKDLLQLILEHATQAQFNELIGAAPFERTAQRRGWRNGNRERRFDTRLGSLDLSIHGRVTAALRPAF